MRTARRPGGFEILSPARRPGGFEIRRKKRFDLLKPGDLKSPNKKKKVHHKLMTHLLFLYSGEFLYFQKSFLLSKIFFTSQKSSDDLQYKYQQEDQGAEAQQSKQKQLNQ